MKNNILLILLVLPIANISHASCNPNIERSAPKTRYIAIGNGAEVKDKVTGLIWQRCSIGQIWSNQKKECSGSATRLSWKNALQQANSLGNGYRLPNIKELHSLSEVSCISPSINREFFPNTKFDDNQMDVYWSSSPRYDIDDYRWVVDFKYGFINASQNSVDDTYGNFVRAVRD